MQLIEESCTSVFTDSASHKTWQNSYTVIDPLTAVDTSLWVNFEFKIWRYSPFLEWLLSVFFLSKYVDVVYTSFQNLYTLHTFPLNRYYISVTILRQIYLFQNYFIQVPVWSRYLVWIIQKMKWLILVFIAQFSKNANKTTQKTSPVNRTLKKYNFLLEAQRNGSLGTS